MLPPRALMLPLLSVTVLVLQHIVLTSASTFEPPMPLQMPPQVLLNGGAAALTPPLKYHMPYVPDFDLRRIAEVVNKQDDTDFLDTSPNELNLKGIVLKDCKFCPSNHYWLANIDKQDLGSGHRVNAFPDRKPAAALFHYLIIPDKHIPLATYLQPRDAHMLYDMYKLCWMHLEANEERFSTINPRWREYIRVGFHLALHSVDHLHAHCMVGDTLFHHNLYKKGQNTLWAPLPEVLENLLDKKPGWDKISWADVLYQHTKLMIDHGGKPYDFKSLNKQLYPYKGELWSVPSPYDDRWKPITDLMARLYSESDTSLLMPNFDTTGNGNRIKKRQRTPSPTMEQNMGGFTVSSQTQQDHHAPAHHHPVSGKQSETVWLHELPGTSTSNENTLYESPTKGHHTERVLHGSPTILSSRRRERTPSKAEPPNTSPDRRTLAATTAADDKYTLYGSPVNDQHELHGSPTISPSSRGRERTPSKAKRPDTSPDRRIPFATAVDDKYTLHGSPERNLQAVLLDSLTISPSSRGRERTSSKAELPDTSPDRRIPVATAVDDKYTLHGSPVRSHQTERVLHGSPTIPSSGREGERTASNLQKKAKSRSNHVETKEPSDKSTKSDNHSHHHKKKPSTHRYDKEVQSKPM